VTNATLTALTGRPGSFVATVTERARFVTDDCTRCKKCHHVCPVVSPNEFDVGLTFRKAIYTPMITTLPEAWVIDIDDCLNKPPNYLPCNRCREVCDDNAIFFDQPLETVHEFHVGSVILAPGMQIQSGEPFADLGYGSHPDVVTSAELQRLMETPGPSGGFVTRPSNEEYPESVLVVLDDPSPFGLYIAASQAKQLIEQDVRKVSVLVLSPPTGEEAAAELEQVTGISVDWGAALQVDAVEGNVGVSFEVHARQHRDVRCEGDRQVNPD
jgi:heterodisulfide reductase subunit A